MYCRLLAVWVALLGSSFATQYAAGASRGASREGSHRRSGVGVASNRSKSRYDDDREGARIRVEQGEPRRRKSNRNRGAESQDDFVSAAPPSRSRRSSKSSSARHSSSRRRKTSATREGRSHSRGMELVPARRNQPKPGLMAGIAASVRGRATSLREDAKGKATEWRNIAKTTVWFSSKMEKFMIQMTWPDDGVLDDVWVKDTMNFLESAGNEPPRSPNNPNKRILRKLWLRMTEPDYRTKLKALQILHHATTDLSPRAHARVRNQFMKMRDETNHKNRNEVYFEPARVLDVSSTGVPFLPLLRSYSAFTFRRMTELHGAPQQLSSVFRSKKTSQAEAVALLRRIEKLICLGTNCKIDRETVNTITSQVLQLTAEDLMSLWRLYVKGLTRLAKSGFRTDKPAPSASVEQLLTEYAKTRSMLKSYLSRFKKIVRDRSVFEDNQVNEDVLQACLGSKSPDGGKHKESTYESSQNGDPGNGGIDVGVNSDAEEDEDDIEEEDEQDAYEL